MKMRVILLCYVLLQLASGTSQTVGPCSFNSMCTCKTDPEVSYKSLKDIACVGVQFARLPDLPNKEVGFMDVVSSGLEVLENESFGSLQVESLRMISNRILLVGERTFSVMTTVLTSLDLSFNDIDEIPFEALRTLRNLEWINLHRNHIASFTTGDWAHLRNTVTSIFLGENDITDLPQSPTRNDVGYVRNSQSLADFKALTWVNLDDNKLAVVPPGTLPTTLQTLSLTNNYIAEIPVDVIEKSEGLSWLYLRGNSIETIPDYVFKSKRGLDKLDLADNAIREITKTIFNGSITIKELYLDYNYVRSLPAQVFRGMNLGRLHMTNNRLKHLDDKALIGTGPYLELLDLENNFLNRIPKALKQLKRLKYFYIPNNNISDIQDDDFESFASVLKALSISRNKLEVIPFNALKDCNKLSHLNIGYNRIARINESDFESWGERLNTLILRHNKLTELQANVFRKTPQLKELSLSFNKLNYIHKDAFADLHHLESLEISFGVYSEEFPKDCLKPLKSLVWLSLDNNHLRSIDSDSLINFNKLQYFNLESNRVERIPNDLFHPSVHDDLRDVRLSYNNLVEIERNTFADLRNLQTVVLNGNKIKMIEPKAFNNLRNLVSLSLTNNRIRSLSESAFANLPNLMKLELQYNELKELSLSAFLNVTNPLAPLLLNLSDNQITNISDGYTGNELYIKWLDLSRNNLHEIPVGILHKLSRSLKHLYLSYNSIAKLDRGAFGDLKLLEMLNLEHNNIVKVERKAFANLESVQIIKLSNNHIDQLQTDQFKNMDNLRILDLGYNHIRSISREIFQNTRIEHLVLSNNEFVVIPNNALGEIGYTLRHLDMSDNHIEHLDSTMFQEIPFLVNLNLSSNKLTILPDNVFVWVGNLLVLDLSNNPLRSNFKELFHNIQKLKKLKLSNTGLVNIPTLPLPNLTVLDLSSNYIENVYINSVEHLSKLRTLILSDNKLTVVPSNVWNYMPLLKTLDISHNPVKIITKDSFNGLKNLQELDVSNLRKLERFDSDSLIKLRILSSIKIQTWPKIEKYRFRLGNLLANVQSLRRLKVHVLESHLTDQLIGSFNPKLKYLEITGPNLKSIEPEAFEGLEEAHELFLKISNTNVQDLKAGVLYRLLNIRHFTLDVSNNKLKSLSSHTLYSNGTSYQNLATKMISGGMILKDNPWSCDCGLIWLGHWLRRWLRETLQIHTVVLEVAQEMQDLIRQAKCTDATGRQTPIVDLYPEDLSCHASALSRGGTERVRFQSLLWTFLFSILWFVS
ncbi:UNVERIFIED_CONTAM: hypothetical protein PYX00_000030 [Menopon gallinae]|uniref:LRRCT domain-containing protein n=1 Tax=Menopon gallinae TaxID=328185 RepID=A0AAW2I8S4_9NEOP